MINDQVILTIAILIGFPVFFVALWSGICFGLGFVSGWQALASQRGLQAPPDSSDMSSISGRMGFVNYNGVLVLKLDPHSVTLWTHALFRVGHRPLRFSHADVECLGASRLFLLKGRRFRLLNQATLFVTESAGAALERWHASASTQ